MSLLKFLSAGPTFTGMRDTTNRYRMRPESLLPKFISPKNPFALPPKTDPVRPAAGAAPSRMETASLFDTEPGGTRSPVAPPPREPKVSLPRVGKPVKVEIKQVEEIVATPKPVAEVLPGSASAASEPAVKAETKIASPAVVVPVPTPTPAPVAANVSPAPSMGEPLAARKTPAVPVTSKPTRERRGWFAWLAVLNPLNLFRGGRAQARARAAAHHPVQGELTLDRVRVVRNDLKDADLEIVPGRLMGMPSGASPILGNPPRPDTSGWSRLNDRIFGLEHTHL